MRNNLILSKCKFFRRAVNCIGIIQCASDNKESAWNARVLGLIPGSGTSPGKGNGYPLQYFCLENSMDRGAWWPQPMGPKRVEHNWVILSATWSQRMLTWNKVDLIGVEISRRTEWILGDKIWRTCLWISSVQSLSYVWLFVTPWTAARQASLSITNSWSLLKLMFIESVMPSNYLILCRPFSSCLQSFPESGSFPVSSFFASGGQSIGDSASVLPMNIQDWFPLRWTGWISLLSKDSRIFSNTTVQKHQFFNAQLSL